MTFQVAEVFDSELKSKIAIFCKFKSFNDWAILVTSPKLMTLNMPETGRVL